MNAKWTSLTILILTPFLFASCFKSKEHITPLADTQTLAEQFAQRGQETDSSSALSSKKNGIVLTAGEADGQSLVDSSSSLNISSDNNKTTTLHFKYYLKDVALDSVTGNTNEDSANVLGGFLESIIRSFAGLVMKIGGNFDVALDPVTFNIPAIDFEMIKDVRINQIRFDVVKEAVNGVMKKTGDLKFLKEMKVSYFNPGANTKDLSKAISLISYDMKQNACNYECIDFNITDMNMVDILKDRSSITLYPQIKIGDVPSSALKIDGVIDLSMKIVLPF